MISAALITGLSGKKPRQCRANAGQSHPLSHIGPGKLVRYMPFVYSLVCDRKVYSAAKSVHDVELNNLQFFNLFSHPSIFPLPASPRGYKGFDLFSNHSASLDGNHTVLSSLLSSARGGSRTILIACLMDRINHLWTSYQRNHSLPQCNHKGEVAAINQRRTLS